MGGVGRDPILEKDWAYTYLGHGFFARYTTKLEIWICYGYNG
jgi:hypothetical protein